MSILVSRNAPDFTAPAVLADGTIVNDYCLSQATKGKYTLLVFYPLDFTFVCPTELIALDHRIGQFKERNVEVIGISIDSQFTHAAWRNTPVDKGGIGPLNFTLVADTNHAIAKAYGIEHPEAGVAFRATFLLDADGIVRHQVVNDLPLGRNMDEARRMVDGWKFHETHGEVCPAGWNEGEAGMTADTDGVKRYLSEKAESL